MPCTSGPPSRGAEDAAVHGVPLTVSTSRQEPAASEGPHSTSGKMESKVFLGNDRRELLLQERGQTCEEDKLRDPNVEMP